MDEQLPLDAQPAQGTDKQGNNVHSRCAECKQAARCSRQQEEVQRVLLQVRHNLQSGRTKLDSEMRCIVAQQNRIESAVDIGPTLSNQKAAEGKSCNESSHQRYVCSIRQAGRQALWLG